MSTNETGTNSPEAAAEPRPASGAGASGAQKAAGEQEAPEGQGMPDDTAAIAFVGQTLAPFFLQDPLTGQAGPAFEAMAALDVEQAACEWPFVEQAEAARDLGLMVDGLAAGAASDELVREYRRLFVGPAPKPAPPWGSVYTDRECVVFGISTLELRTWMRLNDIARTTDEHTPEDHIGLMLALLAYLAQERPALVDEYLKLHLLTWSSHFLDQLEAGATQPFYQGLARLTRASLEGIQHARGIQVTYPRFYR